MVLFSAGSFLNCAKGKVHKNGAFFLLSHFWTAQKGRSIRMVFFCAGSFLDCANGKEHKDVSFMCWLIFGLGKWEES